MIEYMIEENEDLEEAFARRFPTGWVEKKEFIIDLINGTKVILIYMQNFVKELVFVFHYHYNHNKVYKVKNYHLYLMLCFYLASYAVPFSFCDAYYI